MNKTSIIAIFPPRVILANNEAITLKDIEGSVRVGAVIDLDTMKIIGNNVDPDCVGGVCPIR